MRIRNGRRNGLLLILLALLVYAGWLRWADQLQRILTFDLSTVVITVCELTGIIGALLVIVSSLPPPRPKFPPTGAIPIMGARRRKRDARHRARVKFATLPPFGLFCSLLLPGFVVLTILINPYFAKRGERGFVVHSIKDISQVQPFPGYPSLIVRIDPDFRHGGHPHYFIHSEEIPLSRLHDALEEELRYRPDKVVFIQANPDAEYQSVISAVDAAKSAGGAVVLVTSAERRWAR